MSVTNVNAYTINAVNVLPNGKILVQGQTYFRLTSAGTLDTSFGGGDGKATSLLALDRRAGSAVLSDGSFVELQTAGNDNSAALFKFNADGSLDKHFGQGGLFNMSRLPTSQYDLRIGGVTVDASNRIYFSYAFGGDPDQPEESHVVRLTSSGQLDASFGSNGLAYISGYSSGTLVWNSTTRQFVRDADHPLCAPSTSGCRGASSATVDAAGNVYQAFYGSASQNLPSRVFIYSADTYALTDSVSSVANGPSTITMHTF